MGSWKLGLPRVETLPAGSGLEATSQNRRDSYSAKDPGKVFSVAAKI